jgi:hypothetical protein
MTDPTEVQTTAPVTITLDIAALAQHLVPDYGAPFDGEDGPPPMGALDGILKHVASLIVKDIRKEYVQAAAVAARDTVQAEVSAIVQAVLDEGGVIGDGYSKKVTPPLREMIRDEVTGWAGTKVGDSFSRHGQRTNLSELVRTEVDKALKADLTAVIEGERQRFREAIRTTAAALLADDAARRR